MNEILETNDKIEKKSEILAREISKMNYGTIIPHKDISKIIKEPYPSHKYNSELQRAKKILLKEYNRKLLNVRGDGYKIINPGDFVDESLKHYKRGFNEMQKGQDTLEHAPVNDMTNEERTTYRNVYDRAMLINASVKGAVVELRTLGTKKSHPFENIVMN